MTHQTNTIPALDASASDDDLYGALSEAGGIILRAAATQDDAHQAHSEISSYLADTPFGVGAFYGGATRRCGALVKKSSTMRDWATHPKVLALMDRVLGPWCDRYQLNLTQAIRIEPDERAQFLHRDDSLFPISEQVAYPGPLMVNALWALSEFTADNGGTRLIPGSHLWERDREPNVGETVQAEMSPGDVLIYLGSTLHGGGANLSHTPRTGAVISYNLGWLKQTENFALSVPWDVAKDYPETLQRLLGYQLHRPNVGWVEGIDPLDWLKMGCPDTAAATDALTDEQIVMVGEAASNPEQFAAYFS